MRFRSAVGRPIDWRYPSNRFVAGISMLTLLVLGVAVWRLGEPWWVAVSGSIAVFLSWATGRELDPDRPVTAGLAAVIVAGVVWWYPADLLVVAATMLVARLIAGTVGGPVRLFDLVAFIGVGFVAGREIWTWPIAVALGVWTLWAPEAGRRRLVAFAASAGGFVVGWYTTPTVPLALEERGMALAALVLVIGVLSIFGCTATSPTDVRGGQVMVLRVRLARMFVAVVVASVFIGGGVGAGSELAPLVTTLVAVVVVAPFRSRTGPGPSPPPGG